MRALCAAYEVPEEAEHDAVALVSAALGLEASAGADRGEVWVAAALFVAVAQRELEHPASRSSSAAGGVPAGRRVLMLENLLRETRVSVRDFVDHARLLVDADDAGQPTPRGSRARRRLGSVPRSKAVLIQHLDVFEVTSRMFPKFRALWSLAQRGGIADISGGGSSSSSGGGSRRNSNTSIANSSDIKADAAWLVFAIGRRLLEPDGDEQVSLVWLYELLVAVVALVTFPGARPALSRKRGTTSASSVSLAGASKRSRYDNGTNVLPETLVRSLSLDESSQGSQAALPQPLAPPAQHSQPQDPNGYESPRELERFLLDAGADRTEVVHKFFEVREMLVEVLNGDDMEDALGTPHIRAALRRKYEQLVAPIASLDVLSLLEGMDESAVPAEPAPGASASPAVPACTPARPLNGAQHGLYNGSVEHLQAKLSGSAVRAVHEVIKDGAGRVTKSLFNASAPAPAPALAPAGAVASPGAARPPLHPLPVAAHGQAGSPAAQPGCQSPMRGRPPLSSTASTPVTSAVEASNWLSRELDGAVDGPSEKLRRYFCECEVNPEEAVLERARGMRSALELTYRRRRNSAITQELFPETPEPGAAAGGAGSSPVAATPPPVAATATPGLQGPMLLSRSDSMSSMSSTTSTGASNSLERQLVFGSRLYFRVLESILRGEESRAGGIAAARARFNVVLHNDMFHRALFACCHEVVFRSKENYRLMYPVLVRALEVPPLDLLKVLESFKRFIPLLPLLKQHLEAIETDVLEEAAWASGSPLFDMLSQQRRQPAALPQADSQLLDLFLNKLKILANERLRALVVKLGFPLDGPGNFYRALWDVLLAVLEEFPAELLTDRHLDHILLCALHGVTKSIGTTPEVTFRSLLDAYKDTVVRVVESGSVISVVKAGGRAGAAASQPSRLEHITHGILLGSAAKRGDLVEFYNSVFVPAMKETILSCRFKVVTQHTQQTQQLQLQPPKTQPAQPARHVACGESEALAEANEPDSVMSPRRPPSTVASFASPAPTASARGVDMTPRTRELYEFNELSPAPRHGLRRATRGHATGSDLTPPRPQHEEQQPLRSARSKRINNLMLRTGSLGALGTTAPPNAGGAPPQQP